MQCGKKNGNVLSQHIALLPIDQQSRLLNQVLASHCKTKEYIERVNDVTVLKKSFAAIKSNGLDAANNRKCLEKRIIALGGSVETPVTPTSDEQKSESTPAAIMPMRSLTVHHSPAPEDFYENNPFESLNKSDSEENDLCVLSDLDQEEKDTFTSSVLQENEIESLPNPQANLSTQLSKHQLDKQVQNFKKCLRDKKSCLTAKAMWDSNSILQAYFSGQQVNLKDGLIQIDMEECLYNFKAALKSRISVVINAMWEKNGNALSQYIALLPIDQQSRLLNQVLTSNCKTQQYIERVNDVTVLKRSFAAIKGNGREAASKRKRLEKSIIALGGSIETPVTTFTISDEEKSTFINRPATTIHFPIDDQTSLPLDFDLLLHPSKEVKEQDDDENFFAFSPAEWQEQPENQTSFMLPMEGVLAQNSFFNTGPVDLSGTHKQNLTSNKRLRT